MINIIISYLYLSIRKSRHAVGGLVASGFSPSTSVTARLTPFVHSVYQLNPSLDMHGHARTVAQNTFSKWIAPDVMTTPGGVSVFATKIDIRRAALCGGASRATDACLANPQSSIVTISMDDPRFQTIWQEMYYKPHKTLQQHTNPFEGRNTNNIPVVR